MNEDISTMKKSDIYYNKNKKQDKSFQTKKFNKLQKSEFNKRFRAKYYE